MRLLRNPFSWALLPILLSPVGSPTLGAQRKSLPHSRPVLACGICHPGQRSSLGRSLHRGLSDRGDEACLLCHRGALPHQSDRALRPRPPSTSCASCHPKIPTSPFPRAGAAAHPTRSESRRLAKIRRVDRLLAGRHAEPADLEDGGSSADRSGFEVHGLLRAGLRLLAVDGDRRRFDQDIGLDQGLRLLETRVRAVRGGDLFARAEARGLEDRNFRAEAESGPALSPALTLDGRFQRRAWVFAGRGDEHGFDHERTQTETGVRLGSERKDGVRFLWTRGTRRGRRIGSSIVDPGAAPLDTAGSIPVDLVGEYSRLAVEGEHPFGNAALRYEIDWSEEREREDFLLDRPLSGVPGARRWETSRSTASFRGPSTLLALDFDGGLRTSLFFRGSYLEQRAVERGVLQSDDGSPFTKELLALGGGRRRRFAAGFRTSVDLDSRTRLALEGTIRSHFEDLRFRKWETTRRTSPPSSSVAFEVLDLPTRRREREGGFLLNRELFSWLELEIRYRYLRQVLSVPDLEATDTDFRAGGLERHGPGISLVLLPSRKERILLEWEALDSAGIRPTETEAVRGNILRARYRKFAGGGWTLLLSSLLERFRNPVLDSERDRERLAASTRIETSKRGAFTFTGSYERIASTTLSVFFLGSNRLPVRVGYRGRTLSGELAYERDLGEGFTTSTTILLDSTRGSLNARRLEFGEDLRVALDERRGLGLRAAWARVVEADDALRESWQARWVLLYGSWRF